ncbi:MAG: hypothetical protein GY811_23470 [Myxococcales bacterium]|nr:hypothetical protein [Myxococcales bacterium]
MASTIPLSQTINYVDGVSEIAAEDLNAMAAAIVGKQHGPVIQSLSFHSARIMSGEFSFTVGGGWVSVGSNIDSIEVGLDLPVNTVITQIEVFVYQADVKPIEISFGFAMHNTESSGTVAQTEVADAATGYKSIVLDMSAVGEAYRRINADNISKLRVTSDTQAGDILKFAQLTIQKGT